MNNVFINKISYLLLFLTILFFAFKPVESYLFSIVKNEAYPLGRFFTAIFLSLLSIAVLYGLARRLFIAYLMSVWLIFFMLLAWTPMLEASSFDNLHFGVSMLAVALASAAIQLRLEFIKRTNKISENVFPVLIGVELGVYLFLFIGLTLSTVLYNINPHFPARFFNILHYPVQLWLGIVIVFQVSNYLFRVKDHPPTRKGNWIATTKGAYFAFWISLILYSVSVLF